MTNLNSIAINLIVGVGSRYEKLHENGMSHFIEHMLFKGTSSRTAKNIAEDFDKLGSMFNAYTSYERTVYHIKILKENFEKSLEIISDVIQNSTFLEEELRKEKFVIEQEIAASNDNPEELISEKLKTTAFLNQPFGRPIAGTFETIKNFTQEDFKKYINKYYIPSNMYLSAAGNISHDILESVAEKLFNSNVQYSSEKIEYDKAIYSPGYHYIKQDIYQTTLYIAWPSCSYQDLKTLYIVNILSMILGGSMSSRLFQRIREELGLAYSIGSYNSSASDTGLLTIYASTSHENLPLLQDEIVNEILKISSFISETELEITKTQIRTGLCFAEEKSTYKSEQICKNYIIFNKYISMEEILNIISTITTSDVIDIARNIFAKKPTLAIIGTNPNNIDYNNLSDEIISKIK
jgi:predicted Zn-dependent peptidase